MPRFAFAFLMAVALGPTAQAQNLGEQIAQLHSGEPRRRMEAFYGILAQATASSVGSSVRVTTARVASGNPALRIALIEALQVENAYLRQSRELGDDYSDYYGDLLVAVAALRDPRAIPALVDAMGTGNIVASALAEFGQPAAEAVLERLNAGRSRRSACVVLGRMLETTGAGRIADPDARARIEDALEGASKDLGAYVRLSALEALTHSNSAERRQLAVGGLQAFAERSGGIAQAAAFHSLRLMADPVDGRATPIQELAVQALGAIARRPGNPFGPAAVAALKNAAGQGSPEARRAAGELLRDLEQTEWLQRLLPAPPPRQPR